MTSYDDYVAEADTVGQYTGLIDAEDKKIFEGDIMEFYDDPHTIKYDEESARFVAVHEEFPDIPSRIYQQLIDECGKIVIGNIYEDQELI